PWQATALPWIFSLSCRKIYYFGVLCSFEWKIFSCSNSGSYRNTLCISKEAGEAAGKKIHSKPCKSLCEAASDDFSRLMGILLTFFFSERIISLDDIM
ncbi:MAG: hypothetical protein IKV79_03910, partial [Oscillospiraceae bacterium]|nr:hypothetical protein [Oscillospiraceae bacterium]